MSYQFKRATEDQTRVTILLLLLLLFYIMTIIFRQSVLLKRTGKEHGFILVVPFYSVH